MKFLMETVNSLKERMNNNKEHLSPNIKHKPKGERHNREYWHTHGYCDHKSKDWPPSAHPDSKLWSRLSLASASLSYLGKLSRPSRARLLGISNSGGSKWNGSIAVCIPPLSALIRPRSSGSLRLSSGPRVLLFDERRAIWGLANGRSLMERLWLMITPFSF